MKAFPVEFMGHVFVMCFLPKLSSHETPKKIVISTWFK